MLSKTFFSLFHKNVFEKKQAGAELCQGGIKFEISWEPNFRVNNFARNNGKKSRHHPDNNQRKVVTNDKKVRNSQSRYQFTDGPVPFKQWVKKIKPKSIFLSQEISKISEFIRE